MNKCPRSTRAADGPLEIGREVLRRSLLRVRCRFPFATTIFPSFVSVNFMDCTLLLSATLAQSPVDDRLTHRQQLFPFRNTVWASLNNSLGFPEQEYLFHGFKGSRVTTVQ